MARRWTTQEEDERRGELVNLYHEQKKNIGEISKILGIGESTVFNRMQRLGVKTDSYRKISVKCKKKIAYPIFSNELAEFCGIMLGDGHISPTTGQIYIFVNSITDVDYISYLEQLLQRLFNVEISRYNGKNRATTDLFITSVDLITFLNKIGLFVSNKVKDQVKIPVWIFKKKSYKKSFLKGFFDTDGSIYKLRFGIQMCFKNRSIPLLNSTREMLSNLGYHPSKISCFSVYLTRRSDIKRYIDEIGFGNLKHYNRAVQFGII